MRGLRQGDKVTVFVSSLFVAGKIYAVVDKGGKREVKTIADKLMLPNGIEYYKGALYVATPKDITRYDDIEAKLDNPPKPVMVYDKLPGDVPHGWKFIKIGPDGKLYVPVGAPCNICEPPATHAQIFRMNLDGTGMESVAKGVRNTVGFDWDPKTGDLWFTDNGRDWLSETMPNDELNHLTQPGKQNFGFPYCHQGDFVDPQFGWGHSCDGTVKPALLMGPHAAALGMRFYSGKMFPAKYHGAIFVAPRSVEQDHEVRRRRGGRVPQQGRQREVDGALPHRPGGEQQLSRPSGGRAGDEGRVAAGLGRP